MFEIIGALVVVLILMFFSAVMDGWILSTLWEWFVVGALHAPAIGVAQAVGLALTIRYAFRRSKPSEKDDDTPSEKMWKALKALGDSVVMALMFLLIGYVTHLFL